MGPRELQQLTIQSCNPLFRCPVEKCAAAARPSRSTVNEAHAEAFGRRRRSPPDHQRKGAYWICVCRLRRVIAIAFSAGVWKGQERVEQIRSYKISVSSIFFIEAFVACVSYAVAAGRRLTRFGRPKVRAGCHFGDHTLLRGKSAIQRVGKDDRENRSQKIGVHVESAVRIKA